MSGYSSLHAPHAPFCREGATVSVLLFILALGIFGATAFTARLHVPASPDAARLEVSTR